MSRATTQAVYSSLPTEVKQTGLKVGGKIQALPVAKSPDEDQLYIPRTTLYSSDFPQNIFSNGGGEYRSKFPQVDFVEHPFMRIALTVSSAPVTLVNGERLFEQIDLVDPTNPAVPFQTHYDDTAELVMHAKAPAGVQRAIYKTSLIESDAIGKYGTANVLPVGTHYLYVPLMNSVFSNLGGIYLGKMRTQFDVVVRVPSTIIASGAGTVSAVIQFGVEGRLLNDGDRFELERRLMNHSVECNFLQPHRSRKTNVTLTAGSSENYLDLPDVQGTCAYHAIIVRPTGQTNANNGRQNWLNIGDYADARIELVDAQGNSITGSIPTRLMRQHFSSENFDNDFVSSRPIYYLSYAKSIPAALNGKIKGGRYFFPNSSERIRLTLPSAPTQEVQTVTFSATPASAGSYRIRWKGEETPDLVGNSTPAAMAAAFAALRGVAATGLSVVFSAAASAGASLTCTFSDPRGVLDGDLIDFIAGDAFGARVSVARTTAAIPGLATGGYDIDVYSFMYKTAVFTGNQLYSRNYTVAPPQHPQ